MQHVCKSRLSLLLSLGVLLCVPALAGAQVAARNTAVTEARKRVTEALQIVNDLKAEQKRIKDKLINDFGEKEEWRDTVPNLAKAKKAYEAAKRQALLTLKNSPEYKSTLKERDALQLKLEALNKARNPDLNAIRKTGTLLAVEGTKLKKMEGAAVEQDTKALDAKDAFDKADKQMKDLEAEVDAALQSDPEYAQLQLQVDQAEQQLLATKDQLASTIKSSRPPPRAPTAPRGRRGGEFDEP